MPIHGQETNGYASPIVVLNVTPVPELASAARRSLISTAQAKRLIPGVRSLLVFICVEKQGQVLRALQALTLTCRARGETQDLKAGDFFADALRAKPNTHSHHVSRTAGRTCKGWVHQRS